MITGEYLVLNGANALALPTKQGQNLVITSKNSKNSYLFWKSYSYNNEIWFSCLIDYAKMCTIETSDNKVSKTLLDILIEAKKQNASFLKNNSDIIAQTKLDFPRNWGLGSSSTLINNIASWANIDAFSLQLKIFGGSAYDIANAQNNSPIHYQLIDNKPIISKIEFNPPFKNNLYFIHLNKKQNSRESIAKYNKNKHSVIKYIQDISNLTKQITRCNDLTIFEKLIFQHEQIISNIIGIKPIQEKLFSDYFGQTKSLGAWGGDFILATGNENTPIYFKNKGFKTVIPYNKMIL